MHEAHEAAPVDEERGRHCFGVIKLGDRLVGVPCEGKSGPIALRERWDFPLVVLFIFADSNDVKTTGRVPAMQLFELRKRLLAWLAKCTPEVEQHDVAAQTAKRDGGLGADDRCCMEVRGLVAHEGARGAARARGNPRCGVGTAAKDACDQDRETRPNEREMNRHRSTS